MRIRAFVREDLKGYTKMVEELDLEMDAGSSVQDAVRRIGLPEVEIRLYVVNGEAVRKDSLLSEGDELEFFPLVNGG